jgi:hypothetical protein
MRGHPIELSGVYSSLFSLLAEKYNTKFEYKVHKDLPYIYSLGSLMSGWNIFIFNEDVYQVNSEMIH